MLQILRTVSKMLIPLTLSLVSFHRFCNYLMAITDRNKILYKLVKLEGILSQNVYFRKPNLVICVSFFNEIGRR